MDERFLHHFASLKFKKNLTEKEQKNKKGKNEKEDGDFDDMASLNSDEFDLLLGKNRSVINNCFCLRKIRTWRYSRRF